MDLSPFDTASRQPLARVTRNDVKPVRLGGLRLFYQDVLPGPGFALVFTPSGAGASVKLLTLAPFETPTVYVNARTRGLMTADWNAFADDAARLFAGRMGRVYLYGFSAGGSYAAHVAARLAERGHDVRMMLVNPMVQWFPSADVFAEPFASQLDEARRHALTDPEARRRLVANGATLLSLSRALNAGARVLTYVSRFNDGDFWRGQQIAALPGAQIEEIDVDMHDLSAWTLPGLSTRAVLSAYYADHYAREGRADPAAAARDLLAAYDGFSVGYPGPQVKLDGLA